MKWLVALALALPRLAEASHCHETSHVVGREHCSRFGTWSTGFPLWWEFGAVALRFDPKPIDGKSAAMANGEPAIYHVVGAPGDNRPISALGFRLRHTLAFGRHFYFGGEFDWASITGGPRLVTDVAARTTTVTMTGEMGGLVAENKLLVGVHETFGLVTLAAELGPGVRMAVYSTDLLPASAQPPAQPWFIAAAQVAAHAWMTPHITLGVTAGTDLLRGDELSVGVTVGFHFMPFDLTR
jgi:hypothetical protein